MLSRSPSWRTATGGNSCSCITRNAVRLLQAAAPAGLDVVLDPVGGVHFAEALKCVKWGAQVLLIGFASGTIPKVSPFFLLCHAEIGAVRAFKVLTFRDTAKISHLTSLKAL